VFGVDIQEQHESNDTKEGKLYSKYIKKMYAKSGYEKRDQYMFEIFSQLYEDRKTIIIMHNGHLTKENQFYGPSITLNEQYDPNSSNKPNDLFGVFIRKHLKNKKVYCYRKHIFKRIFF